MGRWMGQVVQDLGYAVRSFRRSPAFTLVALLSLTLGIGATSAIFSVIYGVLISPYPYAKPAEIWAPGVRAVDGRGGHTYTPIEIPQMAGLPAFADVMSTSIETVLMTGDFPPESFGGVLLTGNGFNFLGVRPVIGRTIQPSDVRPDGNTEPVVVLSHKLWLRLYQGSADALGKTLRLNDRPHTIVGVMPPRFGWYGNDGFWLPLSLARTDLQWTNPIARLAPGVSKQSAEEQLRAFNQRLAQEKPSTFPKQGFTTTLMNYLDVTVASGEMRTSLQLLLGGVAFRPAGWGSSTREEVHDAGAAQPLHTAATRARVLAARRPGSVGWRTVRRSADYVPHRGTARHRAAPSHNVSRRSGPPSDVRDRASRRPHVRRGRSPARRSRGPRQRDGRKVVAGG